MTNNSFPIMDNVKIILLAFVLFPIAVQAQDAYKCRTQAGLVYQDQPCKKPGAVAEPSTTAPPASDTQARLERDKKYLAERAYIRQKTEAAELVIQCEREVNYLQYQADSVASARLAEYVPNRVGIAQMQLDETRRQTELSGALARIETKKHECEARRRDAERFK